MPKYSDECKAEAVSLYHSSGTAMKTLALELGVSADSLGKWVREAQESHGKLGVTLGLRMFILSIRRFMIRILML